MTVPVKGEFQTPPDGEYPHMSTIGLSVMIITQMAEAAVAKDAARFQQLVMDINEIFAVWSAANGLETKSGGGEVH